MAPHQQQIRFTINSKAEHNARAVIFAAALTFTSSVGIAQEKTCREGSYACPKSVALFQASWFAARGRLARKTPDFGWKFHTEGGKSFQWRYAGPAVRMVLTPPNGDTIGPGLPPDIPLTEPGDYVFAFASNTMAEHIYGRFRVRFRLATSPDVKGKSQN
jgi:hypothetical protein